MLPKSVLSTISTDAPSPNNQVDYLSDWYVTFNSIPYNMSVLFKGPLLYSTVCTNNNDIHYDRLNPFKNTVKNCLLQQQKLEDTENWASSNFVLHNISGLRSSARIQNIEPVNYNES